MCFFPPRGCREVRRLVLREVKWTSPGPLLGLGTRWPFCLTPMGTQPSGYGAGLLEDYGSFLLEGRQASPFVPDISGPFKNHSKASFYQVGSLMPTHQGKGACVSLWSCRTIEPHCSEQHVPQPGPRLVLGTQR